MKKFLLLIVLLLAWSKSYSQAVIVQTYVDRCTGVVYTFSVPINGQTVVVFYNKSKVFTSTEFTNGTLQTWLEQTYQWWSTLSPCSTNQATTTATQQTATQAATNATSAAANAAASSAPPTPPANTGTTATTGTTNTSSNATQSNNTSTNSSSSSTDTGSTSSSGGTSSESNSGTSEGGSSSSGGTEGETKTEETKTEETKTEETKSEEKTEEVKEESKEESKNEKSDESKEEDSEETKDEEKSNDEESEESEEENSEEKSDDEGEKKENKDKKKRNLAPPIVSANLVTMSMIDGQISSAASFGVSQSSLTGLDTYAANAMIWSNLKQFSIGVSKSTVYFKYDKEVPVMLLDPFTGEKYRFGEYYEKGSIDFVLSQSVTYMNMFGTHVIMGGFSNVWMGQKDNFWKGFVGGTAVNGMLMFPKLSDLMVTSSFTAFGTKPFTFKNYPRWTLSPMLAYSASPVSYMPIQKEIYFNPNGTYVVGNNFNFSLTQRFIANLGFTTVGSTSKGIPLSWMLTVGSRFAF